MFTWKAALTDWIECWLVSTKVVSLISPEWQRMREWARGRERVCVCMCFIYIHMHVCFVHIVFISIFSTSAATYSLRFSFSAAILVWALCYTFQIFIVKRDWINVCLCLVLPTLWHSRPTVLHCWYGKSMWLYNIIRLFARSFGRSFIREKELSCLSAWILPFDHTVTMTKNTPIGKKTIVCHTR